jgi:CBS-domain-containing membrane protein
MAREVRTCGALDSIGAAMKILAQNQLHRLPIVDKDDHLVGLLSLADIAREADREHDRATKKEVSDVEVSEVVEAISAPRSARAVAAT